MWPPAPHRGMRPFSCTALGHQRGRGRRIAPPPVALPRIDPNVGITLAAGRHQRSGHDPSRHNGAGHDAFGQQLACIPPQAGPQLKRRRVEQGQVGRRQATYGLVSPHLNRLGQQVGDVVQVPDLAPHINLDDLAQGRRNLGVDEDTGPALDRLQQGPQHTWIWSKARRFLGPGKGLDDGALKVARLAGHIGPAQPPAQHVHRLYGLRSISQCRGQDTMALGLEQANGCRHGLDSS